MIFDKTKSIWYERYKPQRVEDLIIPNAMKQYLKNAIESGNLPNLGLWSELPGLGKSSCANAILKESNAQALWINGSIEKGIDVLRGKIQTFAAQSSFDGMPKYVVIDECLDENEEVRLIENGKIITAKLKYLDKGTIYQCVSFNMDTGKFEQDTCEIISDKVDTVYEVELDDGRLIKVTSNHPFIVQENSKYIEKSINDGLSEQDDIVCDDGLKFLVRITELKQSRVINLTVHKNHTFVTKNGIVTHNCDHLSQDTQAGFRGFLDEFSQNCRFIFTGNYQGKIIQPLLDRLENYDFASFDKQEIITQLVPHIKFILDNENVQYNNQDIVTLIKDNYPKIRTIIGLLQKLSKDNAFKYVEVKHDDVFNVLNSKNYETIYKYVLDLADPDAMFTFLFKNINKFQSPAKATVTLAKYQDMSKNVRDKHLNIMACLIELLN